MPRIDGRRAFFVASLVLVLAIVSGSLSIAARGAGAGEDSLYKYLSVFTEVVNLVRRAYVEETPIDTLMAGALDGATDALDAFATFVPAAAVDGFRAVRELGDRRSGLTLAKERGIAFVAAVAPGSPAAAAGVEKGDIVARLDGRSTRELPLWQMQTALAGEPGRSVALELLRRGELRQAALTLGEFTPLAPAAAAERGVGVVRIAAFDRATAAAVAALVERGRGEGWTGLALDLRGGAPGEPELGYGVAELFASGPLGELKGRGETERRFASQGTAVWSGPLVVLVDRGSLGAAEVLAEVLRQSAGAELVGQRTFGWAGRQELVPLSDGSGVLLAAAFYTAADGAPLRGGLKPDLEVDEGDRSFRDADVPLERLIRDRGVDRLLELAAGARKAA